MAPTGTLIAALLAGTAPADLEAQAVSPAAPGQTAPIPAPDNRGDRAAVGQTAPAGQPAPQAQTAPPTVFRDSEGNPLPPDIQRQLAEELKKNPLPTPTASPRSDAATGDILVTGQRPRGSVVGDIPPERTFGPLDIRAFGASNVGDFIQALGPQVSSNRGRDDSGPVALLNGRRVSDFSEIARIPTEAIERTEIFPEEVALRYGYRADQKVVNIVTFQRFSSRTAQLNLLLPTEGRRDTAGIVADHFTVRGDTRYNFGADYSRSGSLLESERDIASLPDMADLGRFRTLLPATGRLALNGLVSGNLLDGVSSTLNGRFEATNAESLLGLGRDGPLRRNTDIRDLQLGTTQNGLAGRWSWTLTGNYTRSSTRVLTDIGGMAGPRDEARSFNALTDADLVLTGPVLELPAGPLLVSARGGLDIRDFTGRSRRGGVEQRTALSRDRGAFQLNLDLPIVGGTSPLGRMSANGNVAVQRLSDFGTLRTIGYGLNWLPVPAVALVASATNEEGAPSVEQLGSPLVETPNFRTFDFARREVVDVARLFGGNPALRPDDRRIVRLGLVAKPLARTDFTVNIDYVTTRIDDPIAAFPILTPEIEAAFPDRFTRDVDGRLIGIDGRPLNFARSDQEQLRWGVNFTRPLGPVPPGMRNAGRVFANEAAVRAAYPGARVITAAAGSPLARRAENMSSRLFASLYHTWTLRDAIVPRDGAPALDLLNGSAIDFRGGRRRHEVEFQAGAFKRGLGARVTANWQSGTDVQGLGSAAGDLRFASLVTVNINLFANLADRFGGKAVPSWFKGTRATFGVANLFNTRPEVRSAAGTVPLSYRPAYLDPLGRSLVFSLRKIF